jgi:hypothetical protein
VQAFLGSDGEAALRCRCRDRSYLAFYPDRIDAVEEIAD